MSDVKVGRLIEANEPRDAIHIAIAPVVATEKLHPGDHIGFVGADKERVSRSAPHIGIVDPFLLGPVRADERFWMCLYPQTITSLRHDWTHPAFSEPAPVESVKDASGRFLREYAEIAGFSLDRLLDSTEKTLRGDRGFNIHTDIPNEAFEKSADFWRHYEIWTGKTVPDDMRDRVPFYCSC